MYNKYFGFSNPPFVDSGDKVFFNGTAHRAAYDCLQAGIGKRGGVLLFTGDAGAGKTLLLRRLTGEMDRTRIRCITVWDARISFQSLLERLYGALELPFSDKRPRETLEVMGRLLSQGTRLRHYALIVDDAQQLPEETLQGLQQLVELESGGQKLLRVVLSGVPALETRLRTEPSRRPLLGEVDGRCQLDGLEDDELPGYIEARLRAAGYGGLPLFDGDAVKKIAVHARGVPRLVNLICDQTLLLAYLHSEQQGHGKWVRPVAIQSQSFEPVPNRVAAARHGITATQRQDSRPEGAPAPSPPSPESATGVNPMVLPGKVDSGSKGDAKAGNPSLQEIRSDPPILSADLSDLPLEPITATPAMVVPGQVPPMATDSARVPRHSQRPRRSWFLRGLFVIFLIAVATLLTVHYLPVHNGEPLRLSQLRNALQSLLTQLQDMRNSATDSPKPPEPSRQTVPSTPAMATDAAPSSNPVTPTADERAPARADPISALLDKADEQMGELNYIRPDADNALASYHAVLRLDPGNTDALLGIERIKSGFVLWSDAARARGDLSKAENYLKSALVVDPDDAALGEKLDVIRRERESADNPETAAGGDAK